jgi:O-methyltransferase involved in polyketide biosynthesis
MLGVSQYLSRGAVDATLRFASSLKPGSEMVFTFVLKDENRDGLAQLPGSIAKELGEPWKTFHHPDELVDQLGKLGFTNVFHLTPEDAQRRYFSGRQDQLGAPQWEQLIAAIV